MAGPLIYIGKHAIKEGKLEVAKKTTREFVQFLEANHPRIIHLEICFSDDGTEMTVIEVHPDEESLAFRMQVAGEQIARASEFQEATTSIEIYGSPRDTHIQQINRMRQRAFVSFNIAHAGFSRIAVAV